MKDIIQGALLFVAMSFVALQSEADDLQHILENNYNNEPALEFIRYESVLPSHISDFGGSKYLVLDFKPLRTAQLSLQPAIHKACQAILTDIPLLTQLSVDGYDMVSVSFDRANQYDCL